MSEIKVYNINGEVKELEGKSYELEVQLQRLIEKDMKTFFSVDFLATEYSFSNGRIDSLGIDENNCPVIFEYKRNINENVINQGLFYLEWLLDHKADFKLLVLEKFGVERANQIEWKTPIVYCIANKFTRYDVNAVKQMQRNIYLVEYSKYENDILVFDYLNLDLKLNEVKEEGSSLKQTHRDINDRMESLTDKLKPVLEELRAYIRGIDDDVTEVVLRQYIAYKKIGNFITIDLTNDKIQMYLNLDPKEVVLTDNMRDMTDIGHFGTGNLEYIIRSEEDYLNAKSIIQRAYDEN